MPLLHMTAGEKEEHEGGWGLLGQQATSSSCYPDTGFLEKKLPQLLTSKEIMSWRVLDRGRFPALCWLLGDLEQVAQIRNSQQSLVKSMENLKLKGALGLHLWIMGQGSVMREAMHECSSN